MPEIVGESVDKLVNVEMWDDDYPVRGRGHLFYTAARAKHGAPLTYLAAKGLTDNVKKDDYVLILSGIAIWPWVPKGEPDGPAGSASLARAVSFGLGARPVFVGDEAALPAVTAAANAAGISGADREMIEKYRKRTAALSVSFPLGREAARERAVSILDELKPSAVISAGHLGPNSLGVWHASLGQAIDDSTHSHTYRIVEEANRRGIFTVGIGHCAGELGYGVIQQEANEIYSRMYGGVACRCGCGGGETCATKTDVLVTAAVTNWGAYGVSTCLAHMTEDRFVMHDAETERRVLDAMAAAGAGQYRGSTLPWPASTSPTAHYAVVTLLGEILNHATRRLPPYDIPVVEGVTAPPVMDFDDH